MAEKVKILVCGARFGQFYMETIKKNEIICTKMIDFARESAII